jgi:hypothetical protein
VFRLVVRHARALVLAASAAALCACPASASFASQAHGTVLAHAAGSCRIAGQERKLGPTYVTAVSVGGGASCHQALTLVRSYYHCRLKHGGAAGHCTGVEGFRCTEHRFLVIKVQFNAKVTCTRGHEQIRHEFTQFT